MRVTRNQAIKVKVPKPRICFTKGAFYCSDIDASFPCVGQGETPALAYQDWLSQYTRPDILRLLTKHRS